MIPSLSILYVENQTFIDDELALKAGGFVYHVAVDAAGARDRLMNKSYDAVLLDIMLEPGEDKLAPSDVPAYMGGVSVLRMILADQFKAKGNGKDLPVVVYTAVGLPEVKEVILNLLGNHAQERYFEKPENFEEALEALKRAIFERRS